MPLASPAAFGLAAFAMAATALTLPVAAQPAVLDYRKPMPERPPSVSPAIRAALAQASGAEIGAEALAVLGHVRGRLAGTDGVQDVYLIGDRRPTGADRAPEGARQRLVALSAGRVTANLPLPGGIRYRRIAAVVDGDGDGASEFLLESSFFNMGQSATSLDMVAPSPDGTASVRQSLREVAFDGCDNPAGKRERRASTVTLSADGRMQARSHTLRCGR